MRWYRRPLYRCIGVGAVFACVLIVTVIVVVVPHFQKPVEAPTVTTLITLEQLQQVACSFLSIPDLTKCRSTVAFGGSGVRNEATGSTIPTEIGVLTQLTWLDFSFNDFLSSKIPSEIGRLTKLKMLSFWGNQLSSTIPSEFGLLTQLTYLSFHANQLSGTMPSSLCSILDTISIDCGEMQCHCCYQVGSNNSYCG